PRAPRPPPLGARPPSALPAPALCFSPPPAPGPPPPPARPPPAFPRPSPFFPPPRPPPPPPPPAPPPAAPPRPPGARPPPRPRRAPAPARRPPPPVQPWPLPMRLAGDLGREPLDPGVQLGDVTARLGLHKDAAQDPGAIPVGLDPGVPPGHAGRGHPQGAEE